MLMTAAGVVGLLIGFSIAASKLRQAEITIAAFGAAAEEYSTSRATSSAAPLTPGSVQVAPPAGWICVRVACGYGLAKPITFLKTFQSLRLKMSPLSAT